MRCVLFFLLILCNLKAISQPDYWTNLVYFSGCPINHIPKGITIPDKDRQARSIMNSIIDGCSYYELKQKFPDSLDIKLSKLIKGKVIKKNTDHFETLFPVMAGVKRNELKTVIHDKLKGAKLTMDSFINPLEKMLSDRPEMVFHFLWSRIIDECWWNWYKAEFKTRKGPPSIAFIVYPTHPFQCGTNYDNAPDNSQIAISWSYNLFDEFSGFPSTAAFYNLALNKEVSEKERSYFLKHGLIMSDSISKLFVYHEGDKVDLMCDSLKKRYIDQIKGLFNYQELSKEYHIPPDDLFILVGHEIAYEIFEILYEENKSLFIPIIRANNPGLDFSGLISIKLP